MFGCICLYFYVGSLYLEELSGVAVLTQGVEDLDLDDMYLDSDEEEGNWDLLASAVFFWLSRHNESK